MRFKYYKDSDGGFISDEENKVQLLDFREGMGEEYGELIAFLLSDNYAFKKTLQKFLNYKIPL